MLGNRIVRYRDGEGERLPHNNGCRTGCLGDANVWGCLCLDRGGGDSRGHDLFPLFVLHLHLLLCSSHLACLRGGFIASDSTAGDSTAGDSTAGGFTTGGFAPGGLTAGGFAAGGFIAGDFAVAGFSGSYTIVATTTWQEKGREGECTYYEK